MNTDNVKDIVEITFTKTDFSVANLNMGRILSDQFQAILNLIPVAGGVLAQEYQNYKGYQESEFFRKYLVFIMELSDTTVEERSKFSKEIASKAHDAPGNVIAGMVDRLDNINKEIYFARLSRARISGFISIEDYFRLSSMLERIPYTDLDNLQSYQDEYYDENGNTELLYSTGVLRMAKISEDGDKYILSPLGEKFMKWALGKDVIVRKVKGTKTEMFWEKSEEITKENIKNIVNESLDQGAYDSSDKAAFDLDSMKGK